VTTDIQVLAEVGPGLVTATVGTLNLHDFINMLNNLATIPILHLFHERISGWLTLGAVVGVKSTSIKMAHKIICP